MKRIIVFCIALLLLLGCGAPTAPEAAPTAAPTAAAPFEPVPTDDPAPADDPVPQGLVEELLAAWDGAGLLENVYQLEPGDVLDYYGIDLSTCRAGAVFADAVGYTDEVVILTGDKAGLDEAEALLQSHLDAVKAQFRGYDPEALALAEKAVFLREDDCLLFIVSPHAEEMLAAYRSLSSAR